MLALFLGALFFPTFLRSEETAQPSALEQQVQRDLEFLKKNLQHAESGKTWLRLGLAYLQLNRGEEAKAALAEAVKSCSKILEQENAAEAWLVAAETLAAAHEASGNFQAALEVSEKALQEYPARLDALLAKGTEQEYFKNRRRYAATDSLAAVERKVIELRRKLGMVEATQQSRPELWFDLLGYPAVRSDWLRQARSAAAAGREDEALSAYLRALKPVRTVLPTMAAKLPENQAYLNELRQPQAADELREILGFLFCSPGFSRSSGEEKTPAEAGTTSEENVLDSLLKLWQSAWLLDRDHADARAAWQDLGKNSPSSPLALVAKLHIARSYQQEGLHFRALAAFDQAAQIVRSATGGSSTWRTSGSLVAADQKPHTKNDFPLTRSYLTATLAYLRGLSYFRLGQFEQAEKEFENVKERGAASDRLPQAAYRLAQCLEFRGEFAGASKRYDELSKDLSAPLDLRRLAAFAVKRLTAHWEKLGPDPQRREKVIYLGENRSDLGQWKYNHPGTGGFVLCAMHAPSDIVGFGAQGRGVRGQKSEVSKSDSHTPTPPYSHTPTLLPLNPEPRTLNPLLSSGLPALPFNYRVSTSDPKESARRWISLLDDPSQSSLWNPIRHSFTSCNVDDYGEQKPVGQGPDLIVSLAIPAGDWRLSLALINDHNYVESNRVWTLYLKDAQGRFLAGCDVEDHLCGVYKHFAVFGPQELKVYMSRDLSMNALLSGIFLDPLTSHLLIPDDWVMEPKKLERGSPGAKEFAELKRSVEELDRLQKKSPADYASNFREQWRVVELAEQLLAALAPADGKETGVEDPSVIGARDFALRMKWQALRNHAISAAEEKGVIQAWARSLVARFGVQGTATFLAGLRGQFLESGELGRSELIEDQRLEMLLPTLANAPSEAEIQETVFRYCQVDRLYIEPRFKSLVAAFAAEREDAKRAERLQMLAKRCREHQAWLFAQIVYDTIEAKVPLALRGDEHFRHYFRSFEYQGKRNEAITVLQKHLKEMPDSEWDLLWRFNLVSHLLTTGRVDEAIETNGVLAGRHLKHTSVDNLEFMIGLALLQHRKNPVEARKRFKAVIENFPESYWAQCSRNMLKQMGEPVTE